MAVSRFASIGDKDVNFSGYIYRAAQKDLIDFDVVISNGVKRLDHYAFDYYNDANDWWIIAAASGIGWWLQIPEGVVLYIPTDLSQIEDIRESLVNI